LNFADYLYWRKTNLAWHECSNESYMGVKGVNCACHIISPGHILQVIEAKTVYELATAIRSGK